MNEKSACGATTILPFVLFHCLAWPLARSSLLSLYICPLFVTSSSLSLPSLAPLSFSVSATRSACISRLQALFVENVRIGCDRRRRFVRQPNKCLFFRFIHSLVHVLVSLLSVSPLSLCVFDDGRKKYIILIVCYYTHFAETFCCNHFKWFKNIFACPVSFLLFRVNLFQLFACGVDVVAIVVWKQAGNKIVEQMTVAYDEFPPRWLSMMMWRGTHTTNSNLFRERIRRNGKIGQSSLIHQQKCEQTFMSTKPKGRRRRRKEPKNRFEQISKVNKVSSSNRKKNPQHEVHFVHPIFQYEQSWSSVITIRSIKLVDATERPDTRTAVNETRKRKSVKRNRRAGCVTHTQNEVVSSSSTEKFNYGEMEWRPAQVRPQFFVILLHKYRRNISIIPSVPCDPERLPLQPR